MLSGYEHIPSAELEALGPEVPTVLMQIVQDTGVFGLIVSWICCYKGFFTKHSAEGLGTATTEAVVSSSVLILVWDQEVPSPSSLEPLTAPSGQYRGNDVLD
jgi:hypothetical protein